MLGIAHSPHLIPKRRSARAPVLRASESAGDSDPRRHAEKPGRMTECVKHRVEAEARYGLLRSIRGISASR